MGNPIADTNPKDQILDIITAEMESIKHRLSEIKDQITSMQGSVDKEQTRYSNIATDLRNIRDNLDTVPREDMRDKFDEALEVRFRLATMRGQLEKFEANHEYLRQQQGTLNSILTLIQGSDGLMLDDGNANGAVKQRGTQDIIDIINAQEEERQRLARQMHDGPAQSLTNFILQAEICQRLFDRNPDRAAEELNNLKTTASKTFQKVRDFIFDLRPMMLDDLGVAPAVRRFAESYGEKNDIETKVTIENEDRRLENYREVLIFRGIQDIMGMARDYASPTKLSITLNLASDTVRFSVTDDGRGFDASSVFDEDASEVAGNARVKALQLLKNKIESVGGSISVRSSETEGTTVSIELPAGDY